jgi:hypothetical protein
MPPKPQGARALTNAERQARHQERRTQREEAMREALENIRDGTPPGSYAHEIATDALSFYATSTAV